MASRRTPRHQEFDPRSVREKIVETPLNDEMQRSFLEYAYSVIYARALPDARDGLKPVQRRIVYQMGRMNLTPDHAYMKSARVVGEVMGKLHPHGDSAIYEAMVRLAQPFAMRLPLVDGHGNFGSLDDGPAASRYTEARLAPAALGMNADIDEDTVDFTPNYDNKLQEPTVLPAAIPNLLVNGASGIAVGMATNMPTHNLVEVIAAAKLLMVRPDAPLEELMRLVPGPDWPSGGVIIGRDGIRQAYETGRGAFVTRAVTHIENVTARRRAIVVTQLPYLVGPERVLEKISDGVRAHRLEGISGAIDLTDRHNGTRLVIEIKTGFDPTAVLAQLYRHTPLEDGFTINNVALVGGRPRTMGLREMLRVWIGHRRDVVRRRSEHRLTVARERLHLVEGLLLALVDIDEVIQVIRGSDDADTAKTRLMGVFDLDDVQASYILDLRLRRLTRMSRIELESERDDLERRIEELGRILGSSERLDEVVVADMDAAARAWGTPRRTALFDKDEEGSVSAVASQAVLPGEDGSAADAATTPAKALGAPTPSLVLAAAESPSAAASETAAGDLHLEDRPCAVLLGATGLVARAPLETLDLLRERGTRVPGRADAAILGAVRTGTRATYGLVTSAGRLVPAPVGDLPQLAHGTLDVSPGVRAEELVRSTRDTEPVAGERVVAVIGLDGDRPPVAIGTRGGVVKRWNGQSPATKDSWSIIDLHEGDEVLSAGPAGDDDRLVFVSSDASLLTFAAAEVRPQGRGSAGMAGIRLSEGCQVLAFGIIPADRLEWRYDANDEGLSSASGAVVLTVAGDSSALPGTECGAAKVTPLQQYPTKGRATGGVRAQRFLVGQDRLVLAAVGLYPLHAFTDSGAPVELPRPVMRRDASGVELSSPIASVA
ncbi:DNA topoisomerase IV subunit A [uncultured Bifidobacterium sp.]|uniref:DNA gyrase/topoisomerase IV subunit A n=1 Tax=uncultured Bifidobacterium sp. TaxID=165187 RepID=UPI0028DBBD02|nr:DNA topoisomerase IV subunit A [uncultured Bifidobacterium sp.]